MTDRMITTSITRRAAIRRLACYAGGSLLPAQLLGCGRDRSGATEDPAAAPAAERSPEPTDDEARLLAWVTELRNDRSLPERPLGEIAVRVGELAVGTPYEAFTLEEYIRAGGSPMRTEPLTLSLTRFDCVSLVESCVAVARVATAEGPPTWERYAAEMERMRYRSGVRAGYASRLHYFSEWLLDNERRGLVSILGSQLGGVADERPLRFMSSNPHSYPALAYPEVLEEVVAVERSLDAIPRWVIPTGRIESVADRIRSGDILGFATAISGLDVSHAAFAYRGADGVLRVLHAPLSGGVVEITRTTVSQYVAAIRQSTGILVARPLPA